MLIQSKFKYNSEIASKASKLVYKMKKSKKDKVIFYLIPIAFALMIGILIYDIIKSNSLVLDIVLLSLLVVVEILNIIMPIFVAKEQRKYFNKIEQMEYDCFISEYKDGIFKEKVYKNNQMVLFNEISQDKLQNWTIFDNYMLLVFNNYAMLIFDLASLQEGTKEDLTKVVEKAMSYQKK